MTTDLTLNNYCVDTISTQSEKRADDLFITSNSFEERCLGVPKKFAPNYQTRFSCVFRYEANPGEAEQFESHRQGNFRTLEEILSRRSSDRFIPIYCNRQHVGDGLGQFRRLFTDFLAKQNCSAVTIDITCFTKLYLFELLYFLTEEADVKQIRVLYNQPRAYGSANLTEGIGKIFHVPHFSGTFLPNRETVLIVFLGFETERALGIWEHYEPFKTVVILSDPPMRAGYLERAEKKNAFLLSRPAVIRRTMNPYDPFVIERQLEEIYLENCTDNGVEAYNVGMISLGTKVQSVGLFKFWRKHKSIRITYAFPQSYGKGYSERKIGENLAFDLNFDDR